MNRTNDLARVSHSIIHYVNEMAETTDASSSEQVLPIIYGLQQVFPQWVAMICPLHHPSWYYVSNNCVNVFGYEADYIVKKLGPQHYFDQVHPDDVEDLYKVFSFVRSFFEEQPSEEHHLFRMVFNYRFRHSKGHYVMLHDEKVVCRITGKQNLYYSLFRDITSELPYSGVKVEIFKTGNELQRVNSYQPSREQKLSVRESQLIGLIRKGLTTKEIAHMLRISHNTVRNIRSRMFEKYKVNNVIELLNKAG
jgi:DNA-binding CsgD family transcriptional regulator